MEIMTLKILTKVTKIVNFSQIRIYIFPKSKMKKIKFQIELTKPN